MNAEMEGEDFSSGEDLQLRIIGALTECDYDVAKALVDDEDNSKALCSIGWDMVGKVCEMLSDESYKDSLQLRMCEHILQRLCQVGNAKEMLLALLEQVDRFKGDHVFVTLLQPLKSCLLALPARRYHSVALVVDTLCAHLSTLPVPSEQVLEGKERKLLDNDEDVTRMRDLALAFLHFLSAFINDEACEKLRHKLSYSLYKILDVAVARYDVMRFEDGWEPHARHVLDLAALQLFTLNQRRMYTHLIETRRTVEEQEAENKPEAADDDDEEPEVERVSELGVSVFAFVVFGERRYFAELPQMLSHQFWFEVNLTFAQILLKHDSWLTQEKGVCLFTETIARVPQASLPAAFFSSPKVKLALQTLLNVVCSSASKTVSQQALRTFTTFLWSFDASGRAAFVLFVMRKSKHSGVVGYVITQLKEMIHRNLAAGATEQVRQFRAPHLTKLLRCAFELADAERTDLIEESDRIIASLNLLLYLLIRDPRTDDVTGIWSLLPEVERVFCAHLRTGINMSKAHYELELEQVKAGKKIGSGFGDTEVELSVGQEVLPNMTKEQKVQMLSVGLHTFDVMQSILGRISDKINTSQQQHP